MKSLLTLALMVGAAAVANAHEPMYVPQTATPVQVQANYAPTPEIAPVPAETTVEAGTVLCDACDNPGVELYECVRVVRERNIHPCAVPKIVAVPNPCYDPCNVCCPQPKCVFVQICVPPCGCEQVCCAKHGDGLVYSYGGCAVRVVTRGERIIVTYLS